MLWMKIKDDVWINLDSINAMTMTDQSGMFIVNFWSGNVIVGHIQMKNKKVALELIDELGRKVKKHSHEDYLDIRDWY